MGSMFPLHLRPKIITNSRNGLGSTPEATPVSDPAKMGLPILTKPNRPGQELDDHLILASKFLAT